jgi:Zn finger protein HypA/HybF involved in hydrogenase expression
MHNVCGYIDKIINGVNIKMKKRLIKMSITNGDLDDIQVELTPEDADNMIKLKKLDAADVRTGTCPECKYSPLSKKDGIIYCKNCGSAFKIMNNDAFEII